MHRMLTTSVLLAGGLLVGTAYAVPLPDPSRRTTTLDDYACGPGFHLTLWGDCRTNYWRRSPPMPPEVYHRGFYGWVAPLDWRDVPPPPPPSDWLRHRTDDD
jgi:hypothetical protein